VLQTSGELTDAMVMLLDPFVMLILFPAVNVEGVGVPEVDPIITWPFDMEDDQAGVDDEFVINTELAEVGIPLTTFAELENNNWLRVVVAG
jgi:hypothetical protein